MNTTRPDQNDFVPTNPGTNDYSILRVDLASVFPEMCAPELMAEVVARARAQGREPNAQEFWACFGLSANPSIDDRKRILAGWRAYHDVAAMQAAACAEFIAEYEGLKATTAVLRDMKAEVDALTQDQADQEVSSLVMQLKTDPERIAAAEFYRQHGASAFRAHMDARGIRIS